MSLTILPFLLSSFFRHTNERAMPIISHRNPCRVVRHDPALGDHDGRKEEEVERETSVQPREVDSEEEEQVREGSDEGVEGGPVVWVRPD